MAPDSSRALNGLAWILATDRSAQVLNGREAVELAERANELAGHKSAEAMTTLAAAYAAAGRFEQSVATARQAMDLARKAGQNEIVAANEKQLQFYRASRPFQQ